jgi:hypothetical protein
VRPEEWFGFRDHSWSVRQAIGEPLTDLIPSPEIPAGIRGGMKWSPAFFQRPDGTYYETAIFIVEGPWEYSRIEPCLGDPKAGLPQETSAAPV